MKKGWKYIAVIGVLVITLVILNTYSKTMYPDPFLNNSYWVSMDGTKTLEFAKNDILINKIPIHEGATEFNALNGQIWATVNGKIVYLFDYKVAEKTLYLAKETTDKWTNPTKNSSNTEIYIQL